MFVSSFENVDDRTSFSKYYPPKVEIKDFNILIDGKIFFDEPVKNKKEAYEKIIENNKIMITQLVIYWTANTFLSIIN